ncbi:winged helix-turn-helix domain-containing protein [Pseudoalteromonas neustonica]|uniref:winged helix-turn-helix domain-containing protein n=1 Tax=Pseudoalteromonas neustonica TaxID=1840331 RepID=UPI0007DB4F1E|nr:winged helix-turn-helix domain-containing protein [Pseudoalteromonas neustonica]
MRYYFEKYYFDQDTFTLYYNEKPKALKGNEAKLLALFIKNTDEILSKETILDEIWGQQSVSEQVVFQNISQLRSVFGSSAIKTFPKKGYQWQLPFEVKEASEAEKLNEVATKSRKPQTYLYFIASLLLIAMSILLFWLNDNASQNKVASKLYLLPFSISAELDKERVAHFEKRIAENANYLGDNPRLASLDTTALFRYSDMTRENAKLDDQSMLISGYLSSFNESLLFEYKLLGVKRDWHGFVIAKNETDLASSLNDTIENVQRTGYLNEPNPRVLSAKLQLLLEQQPQVPSVIYHVIKQQIGNQQYDIAKALIEKLIEFPHQGPHSPYIALGLYLKGGGFHQQGEYHYALKYYQRALAKVKESKFSDIAYKIEISLAWLAYAKHQPAQLQKHIKKASEYASKKGDVIAQVSAHTTGSILSHKLGDLVNRYQYLNTAKSLLITHNIDDAYFATIYYHLALFASSPIEAESYYLKTLSLPKLSSYQWLYESCVEDLFTWYIDNERWKDALSLSDSQPKNSFNLNQKAKLLRAQKDNVAAISVAKQAFNNARLTYQHNNALHASLLLYQLQKFTSDPNTPEYRNYIRENASVFWLEKHKAELIKLDYFET